MPLATASVTHCSAPHTKTQGHLTRDSCCTDLNTLCRQHGAQRNRTLVHLPTYLCAPSYLPVRTYLPTCAHLPTL